MKLQNKILLPVIVSILVGMVTLSLISFFNGKKEIEKATANSLDLIADSTVRTLDEYMLATETVVGNLALQNVYKHLFSDDYPDAVSEANGELLRYQQNNARFELLAVADQSGNLIASSDPSTVGKVNVADRDYFSRSMRGEAVISDVLLSKSTGNPVFVSTSPIEVDGTIRGFVFGAISLDHFNSTYISPIKIGETGYSYMTNGKGDVIAYPDKEKILNLSLAQFDFGKEMIEVKNGSMRYNFNGVDKSVAFRSSEVTGWIVAMTADDSDVYSGVNTIRNISILVTIFSLLIVGAIVFFLVRTIVNSLLSAIDYAEIVSKGDLTQAQPEAMLRRTDEIGTLSKALQSMVKQLTEVIGIVMNGSEQISSASEELSVGNQDLSNRTEMQASALEETSSAIEEMNSSIRSNADNTASAESLSGEALEKTKDGSDAVNDVIISMNEISVSSNRIAEIIEVINNIAFQTNLLALNASIEAARAGEMGKGFAVVAVEVRKLAKRSDKAAAEIAEIIKDSNKKVEDGVSVANNAGTVLGDINSAVRKVTALIGEIAATSQEQISSVDQIDRTLSALDENTQKNAALVEEAASSTEELSAQAQELLSNIQYFKLNERREMRKKPQVRYIEAPAKEEKREPVLVGADRVNDTYETFSSLADEADFAEF